MTSKIDRELNVVRAPTNSTIVLTSCTEIRFALAEWLDEKTGKRTTSIIFVVPGGEAYQLPSVKEIGDVPLSTGMAQKSAALSEGLSQQIIERLGAAPTGTTSSQPAPHVVPPKDGVNMFRSLNK